VRCVSGVTSTDGIVSWSTVITVQHDGNSTANTQRRSRLSDVVEKWCLVVGRQDRGAARRQEMRKEKKEQATTEQF